MARFSHSNVVMDRYPRHLLRSLLPALALVVLVMAGTRPAEARAELEPCSNHVAPAKQIEIGRKVARQVYRQMPVLPDDSEVTRYVQSLGEKLAAYAPGYKWPFNFHVINVQDINAFALPGGTIFVNLGTIQAADDEAQLAAVMAHEMSHVVLQHSICNMEKEQHVGLLAGLGQLAAGIALGGGVLGNIAQNTIGLGAGLDFLHMSRGAEKQADLEGVHILYDAGYDPRAMPQFFEIIEGKYGKGGAQFLSDHPNPGNRTEYIDAEISRMPPRQRPVTQTDAFRHIHDVVKGMRAYTAKEVASGKWKREGPNGTVETGIPQYDAQAASVDRVNLAAPRDWSTFHGVGFTMQVPSTWRVLGDSDAGMIAPPGGITQAANGRVGNLAYGVLTDVTMTDPGTPPDQQFAALLSDLSSDNPGLQPSSATTIRVAGQTAQSAESVDPNANGGRGEHDWIVGLPGQDGLRYFVFVAPEPDFPTMRPTFQRILESVRTTASRQ
ncbi:MAG TPA: M48 family metalloprotease [Acidobacteriaceae bacterium]|nr:M48 family metalloprotease [Acidobacteriaceae bacterium]